MRRGSFKPKASAPAPRRDRSAEFASVVIERPAARMAAGLGEKAPAVRPVLKLTREKRTVQAIRDSARGEDCEIVLPGCPRDPERTIWSHNRHQAAGKGGALKALDLLGCYGCTHCDAIYDGQAPLPEGWTREMVDLQWYRAHDRSLVKAAKKGLL